jgi:hypothetical protein
MTVLRRCDSDSMRRLMAHQSHVEIGLHLCFADETLSALEDDSAVGRLPPAGKFFRHALARKIHREEIGRNIARQYDWFLKKAGRTPDFIDGHLHAHQLPGVREALVAFVAGLPQNQRPYVRNTREPLANLRHRHLPWVKAALIGAFGAKLLKALRAAHLPTNEGFAGIYDFRNWRDYPAMFPRFADCLRGRNGILVVHPGGNEAWRRQEFDMLRHFDFGPGEPGRFQRTVPEV